MKEKIRTIKIRVGTYHKLKVLAAKRSETMLDLLDRLIEQEGQRQEKAE